VIVQWAGGGQSAEAIALCRVSLLLIVFRLVVGSKVVGCSWAESLANQQTRIAGELNISNLQWKHPSNVAASENSRPTNILED
jgi:hypothetical protein